MGKKSFNKESAKQTVIGNEPEWDLSPLYSGTDDPQINNDLEKLHNMTDDLGKRYKGKIAALNGPDLLAFMKELGGLSSTMTKITTYGSLLQAKNTEKYGPFNQSITKKITGISTELVFIGLELSNITPKDLDKKLAEEPELAQYRIYLESGIKQKPHMLGEEAEKVAKIKSLSGKTGWNKNFDDIAASATYRLDGKTLSEAQTLALLYSPDRTLRRKAATALSKGLKTRLPDYTRIINMLMLDKEQDDKLRGYPHAVSSRNLANNVSDELVDAMSTAVTNSYKETSHRYYALKKRVTTLKTFVDYDRYAPIGKNDDKYSYEQAKEIILTACKKFSPRMTAIIQRAFDENWIDARVTPGKRGGAFSHGGAAITAHPYILTNYMGRWRDVETLAHELGHTVHQYLAAEGQKNNLTAGTPLTTAEIASIFNEMLTFEEMLSRQTDPHKRATLLAGKIESMLATSVRQVSLFDFEKRIHDTFRKKGESLTSEEISDIYEGTQKSSLGPDVKLTPGYRNWWAYIPHIYHTPFYVYSYSSSDLIVNTLYQIYKETPDDKKQEFIDKYIQTLQDGGSISLVDIARRFGKDVNDPSFWNIGLKVLTDKIDQLEDTLEEIREVEIKQEAEKQAHKRAAVKTAAEKLARRFG